MENREGLLRWFWIALIVPVILLILPLLVFAGGGQHYPNGVDQFLMGVGPPPGFYLKEYNYWYHATEFKDNDGHTLKLATHGEELDHLDIYGFIPRFIWISKLNILGGFYGQYLFVPVIKADVRLNAGAPSHSVTLSDSREGVYDLIYSPFVLTWHAKNGLLHAGTALDIFIPTGPYNKKHLVNIGKNFWTFEPVFTITGFLPQHPNLSASIKLMYDFNTKNDDFLIDPFTAAKIGNMALTGMKTHLTPGQEFHFDYGIDYALTKSFRVGIGGYFYQQVTDDKTSVGKVKNDKGRVFSIGPGVWYNYQRWFFDFHTSFETGVKSRPQGRTGFFNIVYAF